MEHFDEEDVDIMQLFASFVGPKLMLGCMGLTRSPRTSSMLSAGAKKDRVSEGQMALGVAKTLDELTL